MQTLLLRGRGTKLPEKGTTLKTAFSVAVVQSMPSSKFEEQQKGSFDAHFVSPESLNPHV